MILEKTLSAKALAAIEKLEAALARVVQSWGGGMTV